MKHLDDNRKLLLIAWLAASLAAIAVLLSMFWTVLIRPASAFSPPSSNPIVLESAQKAESWQAHPSLGLVLSVVSSTPTGQMIQLAFPVVYQGETDCGGVFERQGLIIINNPSWRYEVRPEPSLMRINDGDWRMFDPLMLSEMR